MADQIEEIKSKLDIVELISEYIQLKSAGANYRALCPFHHEKTPSFLVSSEKQIWHCFGCGKGGDIFTFLKEIEGIEFPEVLKILAAKAGVVLSSEQKVSTNQKNKLLEVCDLASRFYQKILESSPVAENARAYLRKRDISPAVIEIFKLGFAPDLSGSLVKFFENRKVNLTDVEAAGLIIKGSGSYFERFRNRIIFPIQDLHGRVVGFTSRILPGVKNEKEVAKYINTSETLIYSKGRVIYGLDKAKVDIKKENAAIIVEGNMDVIACHQFGFKNTVASSGTAFTHEQIMLLKRYTNNLLLAFDFDLAGQNAVNRGIELALQEEMEVKIISIPSGKDPDECLKSSSQGKDLWEKAVRSAQPIMEYYFIKANSGKDFSFSADIKEAKKIFFPALAKLGDAMDRNFWLKKFADTINVSEADLREEFKKIIKSVKNFEEIIDKEESLLISSEQIIAERILSLFIKFPNLIDRGMEDDFINFFIDRDTKKIAEIIVKQYSKDKKGDLSEMVEMAEAEDLRHLIESLDLLAEQEYAKLKYSDAEQEFIKLLDKLKKIWANKKIEELRLKLKEQESSQNNSETIGSLMEEINNLFKKYLK